MKYLLILIPIIIVSCDRPDSIHKQIKYEAEYCRSCTPKQITEVNEYLRICDETLYVSSHCFDRAIYSLCDTIKCDK